MAALNNKEHDLHDINLTSDGILYLAQVHISMNETEIQLKNEKIQQLNKENTNLKQTLCSQVNAIKKLVPLHQLQAAQITKYERLMTLLSDKNLSLKRELFNQTERNRSLERIINSMEIVMQKLGNAESDGDNEENIELVESE